MDDSSEVVDPGVHRRKYSTTTATSSTGATEPQPERLSKAPKRNPIAQGRKYASRACVQCRKKKRRCDGEDCSSCAREGIVCVMDLDTDQRRQINRNNRNSRDRLPEKLLVALRCAPLRDAESLFDAIRQDVPVSQLESMVEQLDSPFNEASGSVFDDAPVTANDATKQSSSYEVPVAADDTKQPSTYQAPDGWKATPTESEMSFPVDPNHNINQESPWTRSWRGTEPRQALHFGSESDVHTSSAYFKSDRFSQVMLSFREAASLQIAGGASTALILSMDGLDLDLFFRDRIASDPHTISTWACEMVKSYTELTPVVQLALVYFSGTFMRWLILPCRVTYTLMSKMMRPFPADSMIHDAAEVEFCRHQGLKLLTSLIMNDQQHNWPYSYASCMADSGAVPVRRLSDFFMEHCDDAYNWEATST